jgi:hypothetical protein
MAAALMLVAFALPAAAQGVSEADQAATQAIIQDQIEAFKAGEHDRAYSHAAPGIKSMFPTVEAFIGMVQGGYMALYRPAEYRFGRNTEIQGEVYQELIVTDETGKVWQAVYTLRKQEDGSWKVTGVKLNPFKGASV